MGVKNEKVFFSNESLIMSAFGIQAHQPINFTMNLTLFEEVIPENSTWEMEAVGMTKMQTKKITPIIKINATL